VTDAMAEHFPIAASSNAWILTSASWSSFQPRVAVDSGRPVEYDFYAERGTLPLRRLAARRRSLSRSARELRRCRPLCPRELWTASLPGSFALHLARVCSKVTAVDSSRPALEVADQNEQLNRSGHTSGEIEWVEANAFDLLKDYSTSASSTTPSSSTLQPSPRRNGW